MYVCMCIYIYLYYITSYHISCYITLYYIILYDINAEADKTSTEGELESLAAYDASCLATYHYYY